MKIRLSKEFNLSEPADNGLRRGRTTGACAAAAVKAALINMLTGESESAVDISLPDGLHHMVIPVHHIERCNDGSVKAEVVKFAGDDPDKTDGAVISAIIQPNNLCQIRFIAGEGVGTVTRSGIRVPVGEPAINPVPRQMILNAISEVTGTENSIGFDITIGCADGKNIALKTFNPRLGILGGISILGTTGIVEPMSLAAYQASIEVYVRVALAEGGLQVAYLPGNIGIAFAKKDLGLTSKLIVHISNFLGAALDATADFLEETKLKLDTLWILGHPGKLAKVLQGVWDTHSSKSAMAMEGLAKLAQETGIEQTLVEKMRLANTVEAIILYMKDCPGEGKFWSTVEKNISARIRDRLCAKTQRIMRVEVRLFAMDGTKLGEAL